MKLSFLTLIVLISILSFPGRSLAQEIIIKRDHHLQKEEFGYKEKVVSKFNLSGKNIIPLQLNQAKDLSKIVFGFLPYWEYSNGAHNNMHYELLTHIAIFDFFASSTGSIKNPSAWPWTDVINAAHGKGTKVILTITNFDGNVDPAEVAHTLMTNNTSKNNLFTNIKNMISTYQLDGVNIDFEAMNSSDRGTVLNNFMKDLSDYIHSNLPGKEVSFDGPAVNWSGWDLDGLTQNVDHVFIMAYDYHGSWSENTGAVSPLTHPSGGICLSRTLSNDYSVPKSKYPEKLILGIPYYGKHWETTTSLANSAVSSYIGSTLYRKTVIDAPDHGGFIWDQNSQTPWFKWMSGGWNQIWADNEESISKKYDLALTENLGGIGIWALNYDGNRSELWDLINTKFGGGVTPLPSSPKSVAVLSKNATSITLKFEAGNHAQGYKVYQSSDNINFNKVKESTSTNIDITDLQPGKVYYFKIESYNSSGISNKTDVLAAIPSTSKSEFLIVDGVERRSFDAIIQYEYPMTELGRTFSSASNEAVINGIIDLNDYKFVLWMLLDESTIDDTFNKTEQAKVKEFINNDGVFLVSGNEIGWDLVEKGDATDKSFYENYLRAEYIADNPSPNNRKVQDNKNTIYNLDDGSHGIIDNQYPDLIKVKNGSERSFVYDGVTINSGYAGVSYQADNGGVEYLGFAIEAVYDHDQRKNLLDQILQKYSSLLAVDHSFINQNIRLYPNPTDGILRISNPNFIQIKKIEVFNIYGQTLSIEIQKERIDLNKLKSGIYFIQIEDENGKKGSFKIIKS